MSFFEYFVSARFTFTGKHDRFVSFVSILSAGGIALGVATLLIVLSVVTGFQNQLRARILSVASHMEIISTEQPFTDWRSIADNYTTHPQVLAAAPNIQEQALLANEQNVRGALVYGILPKQEQQLNSIAEYMSQGSIDELVAGDYKILLGNQLALKLDVAIGDPLLLLTPQSRLTAAGLLPRLRRFRVAGIFDAGVHQFNSSLAYVHLQDAQKVYRLGDSITAIRLKLDDIFNAPLIRQELSKKVPDTYLYDWTVRHGELFNALLIEKRVMFVILTLIVMVASFNIVSALVTMVRNKRAEIAILQAMGATSGNIARIFLLQGAMIGCGGVILGIAAGLPLAANIGSIVAWIEQKIGSSLFPNHLYQFGNLPSEIVASDVLIVAITAFCISLAAAVWPAWRSGRLSPAQSLRHE